MIEVNLLYVEGEAVSQITSKRPLQPPIALKHRQNMKVHLFPISPASTIKHLEDVAVGSEQPKVFQVEPEAESQLLEFPPLAELALL